MMSVRDAGVPRDGDLPTLRPAQIDALVDELIARSSAADTAEPMLGIPARIEPGPRRRWSGRAGLLAVACAVGIIAVASVIGRLTAAPDVGPAAPVTQAPAPNFPCDQPGGTMLTDRAVYLPNPNFGARTLLGMVGDQLLCTEEQPSGVTGSYGPPKPGPVPYFALTGNSNGTQRAYGVADGSVTRARFIPSDAARPSEDAALIEFGDDLVFSFPGIENGVVRFYRGDTVIAEQTVGPTPDPMIAPVPTGQACDPTSDGFRPDLSTLTLADANGKAINVDIYPEPLDPDEPSEGTSGRLCLLVQWAAPAISVSAEPLNTGQPLTFLTETAAGGGTFIWGRLTSGAATVALTDTTGVATSLPARNLDSPQPGQVSFVSFVPADAAQIVSVQALDDDGGKIGEPVLVP